MGSINPRPVEVKCNLRARLQAELDRLMTRWEMAGIFAAEALLRRMGSR
jgi:hypothetical protein